MKKFTFSLLLFFVVAFKSFSQCTALTPKFIFLYQDSDYAGVQTYIFEDNTHGANHYDSLYFKWVLDSTTVVSQGNYVGNHGDPFIALTDGIHTICEYVTYPSLYPGCTWEYCGQIDVKSGDACPTIVPEYTPGSGSFHTGTTYSFKDISLYESGQEYYQWLVNGNTVGSETTTDSLLYSFPLDGSYDVCMEVAEEYGRCWWQTSCQTITVTGACPNVVASFTSTHTANNYTFTSNSTGTNGSQTYEWTVNGTNVGSASTLNYHFTSTGTYDVCLNVIEPSGCTYAPYCKSLSIDSCLPVTAAFYYTTTTSDNNYLFTNASTGTDGAQTYAWTVNGTVAGNGSALNFNATTGIGTYTICLLVSDEGCIFYSNCVDVNYQIGCPNIGLNFTSTHTGNTYTFTDASTGTDGNQIVNFSINNGEAYLPNQGTYTFTSDSSYEVCLSLIDYIANGNSCLYGPYCKTITPGGGSGCPSVVTSFTSNNGGGTYDTGVVYTFTDASTGEDGNQTYNWTANGTSYSTNSSFSAQFTGAGNYTICLTVADDGCNYTEYCQTITVADGPTCPTITPNFTYTHVGDTYTFTDASTGEDGSQLVAWTINGGSPVLNTQYTYTFPTAGSYNVCIEVASFTGTNCYYGPVCKTITVGSSCPTVNVAFTDVNTSGNTYQFTDASTGTNGSQSYTWTINGSTVGNSSSLNYTFSSSGTYTVCLNVTEPGGCTYTPYCKTITIGGCSGVTASYSYSNTGGNSYTFINNSAGTNGSQTYQWTVNNSNSGTGNALNYTFPSAGTYTVCLTVSQSGCTFAPYCQTINISSCPVVNVAYTYVNNGGTSYTFTDASTGENGSQTYAWTVNGNIAGGGSALNYTFPSAGSYAVCLNITEPGGCTYQGYCRTLTISSCPNVVVNFTDVNNGGTSYTFTDASTGENSSQAYNWTVNGNSLGSGSVFNYTFPSSGTYNVCLNITEPGGCTYASYCKTISIGGCTGVVAAYTYVSNGGNSYTYTNASTGTNGSQTYQWSVNNVNVGTGSTLNYTFTSSGTYDVCLNVAQSGCTFAPYCQNFTIATCPNVSVTFNDQSNGGGAYTFTDASTGENGSQTATWTVNGSTVGTGSPFNYTFPSTGTYNVCLDITEPGGCNYSQSCRSINVAACPNVVANYTYTNNGNNSYTFTDASTGENGAQTYNWTVGGTNAGTGSALNYTFANTGTYAVCLNVAETGCTYTPYCNSITINTAASVIITTYAATNVGTTSAALNGGVTSNGTLASNLSFNWGTTGSYGSTVVATPTSASNNATFNANLTGLTPNTTYYFQATGTVSGIGVYGAQQQFTTGTTGVPVILQNGFDISVYPNPAGQQFTVNTHSNDIYTLTLYNMIGQRALTQLITQPVSTVDISTLANGIYNVVIEKDNAVKTYRLVVLNK